MTPKRVDTPMPPSDNSRKWLRLSVCSNPLKENGDNRVFSRKTVSNEEFNGFLAEGTSLIGDLHFSGTLHLNGNVRGSISTADVLIIGERATVEAEIKAGEIQIYGRVSGNIDCAGRVEICETGHVRGDVRTPKLIIKEGGVFEGKSLAAAQESGESVWTSDSTNANVAPLGIPS
jgi:cytoskeletal protein CcmA (bactofilin family)